LAAVLEKNWFESATCAPPSRATWERYEMFGVPSGARVQTMDGTTPSKQASRAASEGGVTRRGPP
jgi:hypothetical protein